jgi:hypothetical protein
MDHGERQKSQPAALRRVSLLKSNKRKRRASFRERSAAFRRVPGFSQARHWAWTHTKVAQRHAGGQSR